ncbi:MAG: hypothetical protein HY875_12425 [Chloroflexi bacterium]|nr:hypothetical protein [Chloroflexota bacterium]
MNNGNGCGLSIDEMQREFHGGWVLIVDPELDAHYEIVRGRVAFHANRREAVDLKVRELRPGRWSVRFMGAWPEGVGYLL